MFAMIASFLLPHLPLFNFVNFAPVNSVLSSIGFIMCVAGLVFFVWARRSLGKNWSTDCFRTSVLSLTFESQLVANMIHLRHGKRLDCT